jgi:hypothetical protein
MKKICIFFCIFFLLSQNKIYANGAGLPPFFKINGKYSVSNPLQQFGITAQSFLIPQDFTQDNYHVNQPVSFEVDQSQLVPVIGLVNLKNTKYLWDFGDKAKAEGLKNSHTYKKIGSYILVLTINIYDSQDQQPTQFIDSFLLNILPEKGQYTLPQAVLKIDNREVKNPLEGPFEVNLSHAISFDASNSRVNSSKPVAYIWNFGDGQTSTEQVTNHKYSDQFTKVVVLRIKDSNGFISDGFAELTESAYGDVQYSSPISDITSNLKYIIGAAVILFIIFVFLVLKFKKKKNKPFLSFLVLIFDKFFI